MRYKKTLIYSFMIFSLVLGLFNVKSAKGALADITYNLNKEVLYSNSTILPFDYSFNLADIVNYTEHYNATYSFTGETNEIGTNIDFIDTDISGVGAEIIIINSIDNHNEIIAFDDQGAGSANGVNDLNDETYGTIEFWIRTTDSAKTTAFYIQETSFANSFNLYILAGDFTYYDTGQNVLQSCLSNTWYHIRIDFECTGGGYLGLAVNEMDVYINGIVYNGLGSRGDPDLINGINIYTEQTLYTTYFDAIGYSWDVDYDIGNNLIPYQEQINDLKQVNAYEFCFENIDDKYEIDETNPETWFTGATGAGVSSIFYDYSSLIPTGTFYKDRVLRMNNLGISTTELSKTNLGIISNFINVSIGLNISLYDLNADMIYIQMEASVNDLIDLRIYKTGGSIRLTYFDGGHTLIYDGLNLDDIYELNILLNLELDQAFIILNENSINIGYFQIPFVNINENELDTIIFYIEGTIGNRIIMDVDYCGIFDNGITAVEYDASYGYTQIKFNTNWNFRNHNLFTLRAIGLIQPINFISADNIVYPSEAADDKLDIFREYTNNTRLNNIYEIEQLFDAGNLYYHDLILYTKHNISYDYINIEGVSLTEGVNKHWLNQTYSGVNTNESYFYVDSNDKLQFSHIANDTNLEYIQAEFNINDVSSNDMAIKYKSAIDNRAFGFFRVNYTDISTFIPFPIKERISRFYLTQGKIVSSFIILITDDDIDTVIGLTNGYISDIELLFVAGVGVSITTSNLLTIIIPLIIIFIPTFLLASRVGKSMIVPLMMLMSLVCVATEIIPIWLFFVIIFPSSLFLFLKRKELMI